MKRSEFRKFSGFGYKMLAGMLVFVFAGYFADVKLGFEHGVLVGFMFGIMYCGYQMYRLMKDFS